MIQSFRNAFSGVKFVLQSERNFRIHLLVFVCVVLLAVYFEITKNEWLILLITSFVVFSIEAINTSIEQLCDFVSKEHHPQIGIVKDVAAGAVVITAIGACIIGVVVFAPYIFQMLNE